MSEGAAGGGAAGGASAPESGPVLVRACRGLPVEHTPVWFMRQAGRSLPEYRAARGTASILEAVTEPELAAEVTLQPVRRYGVDAAILFSDIVVPVHAAGFGVRIVAGRGPVVDRPFATASDLVRLRRLEAGDLSHVGRAARLVDAELEGSGVALIGFAGGPFTLASYLIEGGASRTFGRTKALMHGDQALWQALMDRLVELTITFLTVQVHAGAVAVQLFDSWAGWLSPGDYERFVLPHTRRIWAALQPLGVPRIVFGVGTGELLTLMAESGAEVVGVDWRVPLDAARRRVHPLSVQGNLDPAVCLAPWPVVEHEARDVLARAGSAPGHVFNLGHGVLPETDPGILRALVELVHAEGRAGVAPGELARRGSDG